MTHTQLVRALLRDATAGALLILDVYLITAVIHGG